MSQIFARLLARVPRSWILGMGAALGWIAFSVLRIRRRVAVNNIRRALGLPRDQATALARSCYVHLGRGLVEFLQVPALDARGAEAILGEEGLARLRGNISQGRGIIALSAHIGNWDLLASAAARCGLPVYVVTRQIKTRWINRLWMGGRREAGVHLLPSCGSAGQVVRALRAGGIVAMVLDQHQPDGVIVPFLGRPAATSDAVARLALATDCPVVPVALVRRGQGFHFEVGEPLPLSRDGDKQENIVENTACYARVLGEMVRRWPEQWLWLHRRWKVADAAQDGPRNPNPPARSL